MLRGILDTYHIGDSRNLLSIVPHREFVDTTITSPPYWNLKDYGSPKQLGFGQEYDDYLCDLEKVFRNVYEVTKPTGSLWIVLDTIKDNGQLRLVPFDLANRLKKIGWRLHDIIIWNKDKTLPWSHRGKLRNIFEYILFFSKASRFKYFLSQVRHTEDLKEWWVRYPERYSPGGKAPTRTWTIPIPRQGSWGENWVRHFCPFPPELVRRIALLTTKPDDVILDPFAGSGVVLAQARALGRKYIGIDLRRGFRRMFLDKVQPSLASLEKSKSKAETAKTEEKKRFADTIWSLRKTKYPHELVRLYKKKHRKLDVKGVVAISKRTSDLSVVLLLHRRRPRSLDALTKELKKLMAVPPLSKYGLNVQVSVRNFSSDTQSLGRELDRLKSIIVSLYLDGKTYRAVKCLPLRSFISGLRHTVPSRNGHAPTIASNIWVHIDERKRSRSKAEIWAKAKT